MLIPFPTQDTQPPRAQSPWGALQEPEDSVGLHKANPQPLGAPHSSLGLGVPHWGAQGKFSHQPRHIQQLPLPPNPGMGGTPNPGHPWRATRHHSPCSAPSSLAGPTYPRSSTQPKFCFVRGFGLGFVLFFIFF